MNGTTQIAGSGKTWGVETGSRLQAAGSEEISVAEWPAFCEWLTQGCHGIGITIERHEGGDDLPVICHNLPLDSITARQLENGVPAITIAAERSPNKLLLDVTGPQRMVWHWNPAGWPTRLEISYEMGEIMVLFTGEPSPIRSATANSWGE